MRIIAGESRGQIIEAVKDKNTRPTSGKIKESIFNIIQARVDKSVVLDLFAGTGGLGLEALSRGAAKAFFVDNNKKAVQTIKKNCFNLGYESRCEIFRNDSLRSLTVLAKRDILFDIIFMDPPYDKGYVDPLLLSIGNLNILHKQGIVIVEHNIKTPLPDKVPNLHCYDRRKYGGTGISFYRKE